MSLYDFIYNIATWTVTKNKNYSFFDCIMHTFFDKQIFVFIVKYLQIVVKDV